MPVDDFICNQVQNSQPDCNFIDICITQLKHWFHNAFIKKEKKGWVYFLLTNPVKKIGCWMLIKKWFVHKLYKCVILHYNFPYKRWDRCCVDCNIWSIRNLSTLVKWREKGDNIFWNCSSRIPSCWKSTGSHGEEINLSVRKCQNWRIHDPESITIHTITLPNCCINLTTFLK